MCRVLLYLRGLQAKLVRQCAHHLRVGHQLRLALSTSYWPIVWPAPEAAEVTLHLENCSLILPERRVAKEIAPQNPGAPREYPSLQSEVLREARGTATGPAAASDAPHASRLPPPRAAPG